MDYTMEVALERSQKNQEMIQRYMAIVRGIASYSFDKEPHLQRRGLDLGFVGTDGRYHTAEFKDDLVTHSSGNIAYERQTDMRVGCMLRSQAEYLWYYAIGNRTLHLFDLPALRRMIEPHPLSSWHAYKVNTTKNGVFQYAASGFLINILWIGRQRPHVPYKCYRLAGWRDPGGVELPMCDLASSELMDFLVPYLGGGNPWPSTALDGLSSTTRAI